MHDTSTTTASTTTTDLRLRTAGLGAIGFAAIVVAQNLLRGGSAPANDAPAAEVLTHFADNRGMHAVLGALFVVAVGAIAAFVGGSFRRLTASSRPGWAYAGYAGAIGVVGLFSVIVASEQALSVVAHGDSPDLGAVEALWALHNSAFTVLHAMLAIALVGLAKAGVAAGVTPKAFDRLAPIGGALLAAGAVAGPFIAAGEAMPVFGLAMLGFVTWLAFLVTTGLRMVRSDAR